MDSDRDARIRKYRANIKISGRYYIFFGIWIVLRIFMMFTMRSDFIEYVFSPEDLEELGHIGMLITYIILFIIIGVPVLLIHFFVGINAIRFSKGKTRNIIFLIVAAISLFFTILGLPSYFVRAVEDTFLASFLIDVTMVFLLFDMIYSSIRVAWLTRKQRKRKG